MTWATSVPILVFLAGLSVLDLGPTYVTDRRQTDVRRASSLNGAGHNNLRNSLPESVISADKAFLLRIDWTTTKV